MMIIHSYSSYSSSFSSKASNILRSVVARGGRQRRPVSFPFPNLQHCMYSTSTSTTTKMTDQAPIVSAAAAAAATIDRRALARSTKPIPCYAVDQIPPKKGGDEVYNDLATVVERGIATLTDEFQIPAKDARSWIVPKGAMWRITCCTGPQVADMNCWSMEHNGKERFYSSKTRQIHATHLQTGDRLWSNMPYLRPLATITHETIQYGWDDDGAGVHDVIGSRCDPYTHYCMTGDQQVGTARTCHSNLTRSCLRDGMVEDDVHDVLNVFMCTGFTKDTHQYFTKPSPVQVGDYIEFLAETDLRVAASTCPQGDVSVACGSNDEPICYPLTVQIYQLPQDYLTKQGWEASVVNGYNRSHE